jgi:hypothetical protein
MLMRTVLLAGLALVLLAGCGADGGGTTSYGPGDGNHAALRGPLTFERGGGLKGRRDRLVVQPDGKATLTVRDKTTSIQLTHAELAKLVSDVDGADLGSLAADSTSEKPVPDAFGYRVNYGGDTVTTDQVAMPDELRGLVARLSALVERYQAK